MLILGLGTLGLLGTSSRTIAAPEGTLTFASARAVSRMF